VEAHRVGLERIIQAAHTWVQLICELQCDRSREKTVPDIAEIVFALEGN
jgi:hypothetical protein